STNATPLANNRLVLTASRYLSSAVICDGSNPLEGLNTNASFLERLNMFTELILLTDEICVECVVMITCVLWLWSLSKSVFLIWVCICASGSSISKKLAILFSTFTFSYSNNFKDR